MPSPTGPGTAAHGGLSSGKNAHHAALTYASDDAFYRAQIRVKLPLGNRAHPVQQPAEPSALKILHGGHKADFPLGKSDGRQDEIQHPLVVGHHHRRPFHALGGLVVNFQAQKEFQGGTGRHHRGPINPAARRLGSVCLPVCQIRPSLFHALSLSYHTTGALSISSAGLRKILPQKVPKPAAVGAGSGFVKGLLNASPTMGYCSMPALYWKIYLDILEKKRYPNDNAV